MRRLAFILALFTVAALLSCTKGATDDPGLEGWLRVQGAQFVRGPMPVGVDDGPKVDSILLPTNTIWASLEGRELSGAIDAQGVSAAIALDTDEGYWIVPSGPPDVATPTLPSYKATLSFSPTLAAGTYTLVVRAVDANGVFGPPATQALTATAFPSALPPPEGALVISLHWDTEADLDLHVIDPSGNEIFDGDPSNRPGLMPGHPPPPADAGSYGYLDFDSNAQCVIDGLRREDVIWNGPPPSGRYVVRVDTPSLCGQTIAHWSVQATLNGASIGEADGVSVDENTRGAHDRGAGITALELEVP
jgi:hypothetical protein